MNFFTKQSSKAVAKRFVLLFLTMLAFGFTANAQIPTFNEILERYYNPQDLVVKATAQTPPYGQQFENYTFEEWETVSGSSVEPKNWNSFKTADTKNFILSMGLKDQISKSTEKHTGTTGSYSARVFSTSTLSVIANGNMTTGKIYAGSTTANSDSNYNFTKRSDANFNNPLTTIPDSLTVWVAFKPKDASKGNARITTTIHGDTDLKQLAKSGDSPANMVCATANAEITATSTSAVVWKRMSIPFVKGSNNDPRYILATFNTNATPGGGSANDELYVDDICLIYNPSLNMELLAQTEYNVSNINSANISVPFTLNGSMSVYNINKSDNEVIAQLSDANGSFANPIELGRVTTNVSGTINGAIPAGTPAGTGYKVRVVSTNYPMVSNETNVAINFTYIPVPEVEIALGDVLAKSAVATFAPNTDCANYYFVIVPATQSVNAAYVKANGQAKSGEFTATFENLISNTEYKVYALPLTSDGVEGEMASATLKTDALVPQVEIAQGEVATKSATATFTPKADCVEYYFLIALATETVDAAYVKANGQEKSGEFTATFENLISNTNYKVYALPFDVEGTAGELKTLAFKTQAFVPQIDVVRNEYAAKSITATFTPDTDCAEYYFLISTETVDAAYIKANGEKQTEVFTTTFENLTSNTAYTIYALPVDIDGFNGEIKTISVTTKALVPQITLAQGEVATKSATATFTPNGDCVEYYFLISTEIVDAAYVKENGETKTEAFTATFENLISNTDYVIYALPIDVEGTAGELKTLAVKTQAFVPQVDVERGNVAAKSITMTFTPNTDCVEYYIMIAVATDTLNAEYIKSNGEKQTEVFTTTFENLTSNTAYTIYALPVDIDGFNGAIKSVTITTNALVPQVEIAQGEVATKSAVATFTPNGDCVEYYFLISTEIVDAAYVKENGETKTEAFTATFENLISNTDYVIYALPIDVEGTAGELKTLAVKTQAFVPQVDVERGNVAAKSITMTFTPNTDCVEYYIMIAVATDTLNAEYIKSNGEKQTEVFTTTFENLTSNTAYTIYALPVDIDGFNGTIKSVSITTNALVPQVEIAQGEVATKSATATFTPNADCVEYYFLIVPATDIVNSEYIKSNGEKQTETFTATFENLISNTDYVIYALPIDVEGTAGELKTLAVKTQAFVPQVDVERGNVAAKSITMTFTPNADCVEYYFVIATDEVVDAAYIKANGEKQTEVFTTTFENLTSNTSYTIYALPVDIDGFNGTIKSVTITTNALVPQVVITKDEALAYSMTTSFAPNSDCVEYYFLIAESTETVDATYVKENGEAKTEAYTATWENLLPSTNYTIYALPIDVEGKEGNLNTLTVKTRAEAGVSEIDIEIEKMSYTSATITATPNENTILYHYIVIEKAEADAMGEDALMQLLNENENYIDSIVDVYSMTVESNVAYYVVAQGKNRDDKWGVVTKEEFTVAGPSTVAIAVEKLNETSVEVTATPNENTVSYQYIVIEKAEADAMDESSLIQKLETANSHNSVDVWTYTVKSNVEYYVIAQGKNADGKTGEMTKVEFTVAGPATVAIAVEKLNETTVSVASTPNENAVAYSYIIITKSEADAMTAEEIAERLNASENKFESANTKEFTIESNVAYYVIAQAKNADDMSGLMTKVEFVVAGPSTVAIAVEKLNETSVEVTATPNENTVSYQYIVIKKSEADAMDESALIQKLEAANSQTSVDEWTYTVESNVEYYVIARGKNADGMIGEMTKVEFVVAGPATVAIAVEKLNETTVSVASTPNENAVAYSYIIITKSEADAMTAEEIAERLNASENKFESANTKEFTIESNVAYYVIAQAKNADDMSGLMTKVEFVVAGPSTVAIAVEKLNETSVEVTATPNENTVSYQYIVIKKSEADAMDESALIQKLEAANSQTSVDEWTYTVESNVEYYVIARGKNADGMIGEMTKVGFVVAGPATVAIAVEETSETSVSVTSTPNENAVSYSYIVIAKAEADTMSAEEIAERLNASENKFEAANTKEFTIESNVAYYVIAQAKNADDMFGAVTKVEFMVEVAGPATVAIAVEETSNTTVSITATPNENAVVYHYIVIEKAEADAMEESALMQKLNENENYLEGVDVCDWTVKSNVEYYVIAQAKNADDKWGEVTKVEFMVEVAGPAYVAIEVKEVTETSVSITATPNENTVAYHYIVIEKAEADAMEESALMQKLNENEDYLEGANTKEVTVESNVEYYVLAQGKNADEVWGELTKVEFVVVVTDTVSVSELDKVEFEVYPNPATEYVRITSNSEIESLVIFSVDGKMVHSEDVNQEETMIDVTSFAKGSYIVRMISNGEFVVRRIIVK